MMKEVIHSDEAPNPIGAYSQAIRAHSMLYISGQIALNPTHTDTVDLSSVPIETQVKQVFENLKAICEAGGGSLNQVVKLTVYLMNLEDIKWVNEAIEARFSEPYPARVALGVQSLPRGAKVEIDAIMTCSTTGTV